MKSILFVIVIALLVASRTVGFVVVGSLDRTFASSASSQTTVSVQTTGAISINASNGRIVG